MVTTLRPRVSGGRTKFGKWYTSAGPANQSNGGQEKRFQACCTMRPGTHRQACWTEPGTGKGTPLC